MNAYFYWDIYIILMDWLYYFNVMNVKIENVM